MKTRKKKMSCENMLKLFFSHFRKYLNYSNKQNSTWKFIFLDFYFAEYLEEKTRHNLKFSQKYFFFVKKMKI